jgi:hypothetical protein
MRNRLLKLGLVIAGFALGAALLPAGTSGASLYKAHHTKSPKKKSSSATCPTAASLGAAAKTTYTGPDSEKGAEKGWVVCQYSTQGEISLLVSLYTTNDSLRSISSDAPVATKKVSGIGNAASHYGTIVYVQRKSAPSFSVIDQSGDLTLSQTEAMAKAIAAG